MGVWTTSPRTWAVSEVLTATNLNAQLRDFQNGFGAFTSYTPTLTGFTLGNGTISGAYLQVQKLVVFRALLTFGTTTTAATTTPTITLPVTASSGHTALMPIGQAGFFDTAPGAMYAAALRYASTTTASAAVIGTNGLHANCTTTSPFTWATGDQVYWLGTYEAA